MKIVPTAVCEQELLNIIPYSEVVRPTDNRCIISPWRDMQVVCPHESWMTTEFWTRVLKPSLNSYEAEKFDCDDFSIRCLDRITACLNATKQLENAGYAASVCYLRIEGHLLGVADALHANVMYRDDRGGWWFFEPQNGRQIRAEAEIANGVATPYFLFL